MAVGLPIITSDVGGNYGYLTPDNSMLVDKGDYDSLIDATVELLKNEEKIKNMSLESIQVSKDFDWTKVVKQAKMNFITHVRIFRRIFFTQ